MSSPRLKWLRIHRYRDVVPGTYLEFGSGFNVLLGRNGTGKTTLLELIEMIWARGFGRVADEPFHLEYAVEWDDLDTRPAADSPPRRIPGFVIEVHVENQVSDAKTGDVSRRSAYEFGGQFSYCVAVKTLQGSVALQVEGRPTGASLRFKDSSTAVPVANAASWPLVWTAPAQVFSLDEIELEDDVIIWAARCRYVLELVTNEGRFDESLGAFRALTSNDYESPGNLLHESPGSGLLGTRWECERLLTSEPSVRLREPSACAFMPRELAANLVEELSSDPRREPPELRRSLTAIPILSAFPELTGYPEVLLEFRPNARRKLDAVERLGYRTPDFRIVLPHDRGEIPPEALSYGEKRLLSFLWYLACRPSAVIADELVNGFHHAWISRCVELMDGRQAFLASQNPLLLDCLPFEDVESVRRCFITCRRGPDTGDQMNWSNLTIEEAADFFRAYQRETQYVHEILRGKGLW